MRRTLLLAPGLALVIAACSAGDGATGAPVNSTGEMRSVTATLNDDMTIELSDAEFAVGETVVFHVTNAGTIVHEFYLGDEEEQSHHAEEMADMGMSHDDPNGVAVDPGATEELEYTFADDGELLVGCHEPGHYEAGMAVTMAVSGD